MQEPWSNGRPGLTPSASSGRPRTGASVESGSGEAAGEVTFVWCSGLHLHGLIHYTVSVFRAHDSFILP